MNREPVEQFSMLDPRHQTERDHAYASGMDAYFTQSLGTPIDKLRNFTKFVPRQCLARFLVKHEIFQRVLGVHGHIIECGVYLGDGLMTWGQFSAIYEPYNHTRRIVGFDTFTGFTAVRQEDEGDSMACAQPGGLATHAYQDLQECIRLFDLNRPIGHVPRLELVVGDAMRTVPEYLERNRHLVVAMLYLDFDLYEPTKVALETFLPRMPKGGVIVFDELNQAQWPGETLAALECVGLRNLRLQRSPFHSQPCFAVLD